VAAVKIETEEEKLADGAEVARECKMQRGECRPAINGISREKPQNSRNFEMGSGPDDRFEARSQFLPAMSIKVTFRGKPCAGKYHVRFLSPVSLY
jgi:hypothetical protein